MRGCRSISPGSRSSLGGRRARSPSSGPRSTSWSVCEEGLLASVAALLAEVLYRLGRDEEAEEWTRRSERAASLEDVEAQAFWRIVRAKVPARRGNAEEALRLSAEAVEWVHRSDSLPVIGDCLSDRAEVLRLLGRPDEARPLLGEALAVYERKGIVPSIERTRTLLAEIPAGPR